MLGLIPVLVLLQPRYHLQQESRTLAAHQLNLHSRLAHPH